jgi:transcriptional regulator with XRE-family HTH domain
MTTPTSPVPTIFAKRLKAARKAQGLTQQALGVMAGMEELSASARMNHYEQGKHWPHYSVVEKIAEALDLPVAYFYCKEDNEAELLRLFHQLDDVKQEIIVKLLKGSLD